MKSYFTLKDFNFKNKQVLVRVDFNVPLDAKGNVADDFKIRQALPTIEHIVKQGGIPILISHLGRPEGVDEKLRMCHISRALQKLTKYEVLNCNDCVGDEADEAIREAHHGTIIVLENVRFHREEEENDAGFAQSLASLADLFVMDAFGTMHRQHASVVGIPQFLPAAAGFLVQKELEVFDRIFLKPKKLFIGILGGAKISTKIGVIEKLKKKVDALLIGGAMANTFCRAQGLETGKSLVEEGFISKARSLMKSKLVLPVDYAVEMAGRTKIVSANNIPANAAARDIGPKTVKKFKAILKKAKTVFWNGPLGQFEIKKFAKSTNEIAKFLTTLKADTVVGGGETADAVRKFEKKLTHVSTGGGAALELLEKGTLPGITALERNHLKYKNY